jgi:hypothetical protein
MLIQVGNRAPLLKGARGPDEEGCRRLWAFRVQERSDPRHERPQVRKYSVAATNHLAHRLVRAKVEGAAVHRASVQRRAKRSGHATKWQRFSLQLWSNAEQGVERSVRLR